MRSRSSHAAESGVGEHTARESECAQRMRRERVRGGSMLAVLMADGIQFLIGKSALSLPTRLCLPFQKEFVSMPAFPGQ